MSLLCLSAVGTAVGQEAAGFGRYYALVIGNQNYSHLGTLHTPLADAQKIAEILKGQYRFDDVDLLLDASRKEIMEAVSKWCVRVNRKEDNLLIYYAGHGDLDPETGLGYWQPVEAKKQDSDWIPTFWITSKLKAIPARHVLVVADSCYSGSLLTRELNMQPPIDKEWGEWFIRMQKKRSFTALTSGGEEPVRDTGGGKHSVFAKVFIEALQKNKGILDGTSLFGQVKKRVVINAAQTPQYGYVQTASSGPGSFHERGDFLLVPWEIRRKGLLPAGQNGLTEDLFRGAPPAIQPVGAEYKAIKDVRIRRWPQFTSQHVGMLKKGNAVWVVGKVEEQPWYLVDHGKRQQYQGYIYSSSLQKKTDFKVVTRERITVAAAARNESPAPEVSAQGKTMADPITGMQFVSVPKGCFQMGSPPDEKGRFDDEGPVREVCVDGFWMGKYEVTQGQWQKIMTDNPAKFQKGDKYPVESVSWEDAQKFIIKLNKKSGKEYRLPTEAEWEYAARAGTKTSRHWGDDISCDKAMYDNYSETANCAKSVRKRGLKNGSTAPVGSYSSNQFGLHDMLGNVYEWCADWYGDYSSSLQTNPVGPFSGSDRVMRGGSWGGDGRDVRSAYRRHDSPVNRGQRGGFRLVLGQ
ncbi:hypothetical protein KKHLCK_06335 [Candidatus Electrothrix laxa]